MAVLMKPAEIPPGPRLRHAIHLFQELGKISMITSIIRNMIPLTPPPRKKTYWPFGRNVNIRRLYRLNLFTNPVWPAESNFRITRASNIRELPGININNIIATINSVTFQVFESCDNTIDLVL